MSPSKAGELRTQYLAESPPNVDNKKNSNNSDSDAAGFGRGGKGCPSSPKSATKRRSVRQNDTALVLGFEMPSDDMWSFRLLVELLIGLLLGLLLG